VPSKLEIRLFPIISAQEKTTNNISCGGLAVGLWKPGAINENSRLRLDDYPSCGEAGSYSPSNECSIFVAKSPVNPSGLLLERKIDAIFKGDLPPIFVPLTKLVQLAGSVQVGH
jgi:hypothetical protein